MHVFKFKSTVASLRRCIMPRMHTRRTEYIFLPVGVYRAVFGFFPTPHIVSTVDILDKGMTDGVLLNLQDLGMDRWRLPPGTVIIKMHQQRVGGN